MVENFMRQLRCCAIIRRRCSILSHLVGLRVQKMHKHRNLIQTNRTDETNEDIKKRNFGDRLALDTGAINIKCKIEIAGSRSARDE